MRNVQVKVGQNKKKLKIVFVFAPQCTFKSGRAKKHAPSLPLRPPYRKKNTAEPKWDKIRGEALWAFKRDTFTAWLKVCSEASPSSAHLGERGQTFFASRVKKIATAAPSLLTGLHNCVVSPRGRRQSGALWRRSLQGFQGWDGSKHCGY